MRFHVSFKEQNMQMNAQFSASSQSFGTTFAAFQRVTEFKDADPYTGSYEVTPEVDAQVLPTKKKLMTDNLTVKGIPIYEVSNQADGETVYIATEVDIYGG